MGKVVKQTNNLIIHQPKTYCIIEQHFLQTQIEAIECKIKLCSRLIKTSGLT